MKSIGFSASNKSQSGPAGRATLGRTSSVVVPKTAKGKIDFSQVAQLREDIELRDDYFIPYAGPDFTKNRR